MLSKKWRERFTDDPNNRDRSNSLYPTLRRGVNLNPTLQIPESKTECWGIIGWCSQKHMQLREEKELIPVLFPRADARGPIEALVRGSRCVPRGRFPRADARGPIEACLTSPPSSTVKVFPRADARGPIEASQRNGQACSPSRFPRADARGPIEALGS